jgi:predicted Zn-dependent protease
VGGSLGRRPIGISRQTGPDWLVQEDSETARKEYTDGPQLLGNFRVRFNVPLLQWKTQSPSEAWPTLNPLRSAKYGPALRLAAAIYEEQGDTHRAVEILRSAIALNPKDEDGYLDFATISFRHRSYQAGIRMLDAGIAAISDCPSLFAVRGILEAQLAEKERGFADLAKAHRLDPRLSAVNECAWGR